MSDYNWDADVYSAIAINENIESDSNLESSDDERVSESFPGENLNLEKPHNSNEPEKKKEYLQTLKVGSWTEKTSPRLQGTFIIDTWSQ